jgi:Transcriptional regulators
VSLKDIALQAGVSITTVSRILNQDSSLSVADETRQRVEKIANEMNYKPNKKSPGQLLSGS